MIYNHHIKSFVIKIGLVVGLLISHDAWSLNAPIVAKKGLVVTASQIASDVGALILNRGGNAIDSAVATAFALAVTHPTAGNIGGGGFLVYRTSKGAAYTYDFRETAPAGASADMWLEQGQYSFNRHHRSHLSVGIPGTVAGLFMAWQSHGSLPWDVLIQPAIKLARKGFPVSHQLAASLERALPRFSDHPASMAQFSNSGKPYKPGEILEQKDLGRTLERIAKHGPEGFYTGKTAELIVREMVRGSGLITLEDLASYQAKRRDPIVGTYRGYEVISMAPPSSGGVTLIQMLNVLEGFPISEYGYGSAAYMHIAVEAMRRAFLDRAKYLGDPDFYLGSRISELASKNYADNQRSNINEEKASKSELHQIRPHRESEDTTHLSIVDKERNAVSLTYTLEWGYGSGIVVPGAGFLLNNEMGDFNAVPGLTDKRGLIGTKPNLAEPNKRMLSSMTPTILAKGGELFMVTGAPGGRTIINTVLETIVNVVDFEMNAQAAVDAARFHHQWFPDKIFVEKQGFSPDTLALLDSKGHVLMERERQGRSYTIVVNSVDNRLEAGVDNRLRDAGVGTHD